VNLERVIRKAGSEMVSVGLVSDVVVAKPNPIGSPWTDREHEDVEYPGWPRNARSFEIDQREAFDDLVVGPFGLERDRDVQPTAARIDVDANEPTVSAIRGQVEMPPA